MTSLLRAHAWETKRDRPDLHKRRKWWRRGAVASFVLGLLLLGALLFVSLAIMAIKPVGILGIVFIVAFGIVWLVTYGGPLPEEDEPERFNVS